MFTPSFGTQFTDMFGDISCNKNKEAAHYKLQLHFLRILNTIECIHDKIDLISFRYFSCEMLQMIGSTTTRELAKNVAMMYTVGFVIAAFGSIMSNTIIGQYTIMKDAVKPKTIF